jgi:hypothetical protein
MSQNHLTKKIMEAKTMAALVIQRLKESQGPRYLHRSLVRKITTD